MAKRRVTHLVNLTPPNLPLLNKLLKPNIHGLILPIRDLESEAIYNSHFFQSTPRRPTDIARDNRLSQVNATYAIDNDLVDYMERLVSFFAEQKQSSRRV